ncbi:WD40 repeat domain-containing protein [Tengunoibacter tsumagoiensis]|uniref:Testis-expressed protein 13A/C/D zinc finger domain-containing protein n=1 Tax=Tengunoibacter tsumagoiensis TaxID=2014871 RepID=A0A402A851_9CHLR|nr:hypothetical protein [Tengunoibacter tsumagoiensis]GCE15347.1 hypothetical protein KTT_52060 [Tengunoibacter tsumagoiensis]
MSTSPMACPVCRALNDPRLERCYRCGHQFQQVAVSERGQRLGDKPGTTSGDGLSHISGTSRRTALLIVGGVVGSAIGLPVVAVGGYLLYQHLTDQHIITYYGYSNTTSDAAWSPDGTLVASAGWLDGGTVQIWDPLTGQKLHTCHPEHVSQDIYPQRVMWSADGKQVLAFVGHGWAVMEPGSRVFEQVQVWDVASGRRVRNIPLMDPVTVDTSGSQTDLLQHWTLGERYFAAAQALRMALVDSIKHGVGFSSTSSTLSLLDALSGKQRAAYAGRGLFGNGGTSGNLSWSPNGKYLMVVGQYVDIWHTGV